MPLSMGRCVMAGLLFISLWGAGGASAQARYSTGSISGKLTTPDGKPAAGVRVRAAGYINDEQVLLGLTTSDAAGVYRIAEIPPGRWAVLAGSINEPTYYPGVAAARDGTLVTVLSGVPTEGVDFVVPAPEPPLSNNTPFRFSPGPYACAPTLDWVCEESRSFSFDVAANSLLPRTTGRLSGTVTGKTGMPLLDVMVTLSREDTTLPLQYSTQTDFAGRYVFPNVRPGSYSIQVTIDGQRVVVRIEIEARDRQMDIGPLGAVAPAR